MTEARAQSTPYEGCEHSFGHVSHIDCCHSPSCAVRSCGAQPPLWRGICWQRASFTVLRGWSGRCIWGQHRQESTFSSQLALCIPQLQDVWSWCPGRGTGGGGQKRKLSVDQTCWLKSWPHQLLHVASVASRSVAQPCSVYVCMCRLTDAPHGMTGHTPHRHH